MEMTPKHLRVLEEMSQQGRISRSQLTVGPLRHVEREMRRQIMDDLAKASYVECIEVKETRGPVAHYYRITEAGRKASTSSAQR